MPEEVIEEFIDNFSGIHICKYQKLSIEFIEKYKNKLHWYGISRYQKLNKKFIYINRRKIIFEELIRNKYQYEFSSGELIIYKKYIKPVLKNDINEFKSLQPNFTNDILEYYKKD